MANGTSNGVGTAFFSGVSLQELPKSDVFTANLPPDPEFMTPAASHKAPLSNLGPRAVKGALFTYVRPEQTVRPELLGTSKTAMRDLGLKEGEEKTDEFQQLVSGNKIFWNPEREEGIYPWAQCYGGWQFGSWAGQLGDGRAISLFESTNPSTRIRYEVQLKGAGKTPYSRFADGKAVLRSSIREFVVSEALNALQIPTTRALSLTLLPDSHIRRERIEPGAIVARFAESWLRIGTYDIIRARGDKKLIQTLSDYLAQHVYSGWRSLPSAINTTENLETAVHKVIRDIPPEKVESFGFEQNRYCRLYREICRRNAVTVAAWQAYAFTNGVLNTDNTSLFGLSLDFGPFAFLDNYDPSYTPNHDDHTLRYSYKNQPSIIWWNLSRLGESMAILVGAGSRVDEGDFMEEELSETFALELIDRAKKVLHSVGEEYKVVFKAEYTRLMRKRLGLVSEQQKDFDEIVDELLNTLEALELDYNHFFRRLSSVKVSDLEGDDMCKDKAGIFFHAEGIPATAGITEAAARERMAGWLQKWQQRIKQDWGTERDEEREREMKQVNPKFIPRSWVLDEIIQRVEKGGERDVIDRVMQMAEHPFEDEWAGDPEEAERWCGDVPRQGRMMQCSCSS